MGSSQLKLLVAALFFAIANAATVTYNFNVSWIWTGPTADGHRSTMGINGQWPIPAIDVNVNDTVIVHVYNGLGNATTSLHFHGLYQNGTSHMDGASQVSQCAIAPGSSFTYNFTVEQPGTYWYHSHVRGQYPDGLRGPLIVRDSQNPFKGQYDEEIVLTFSDWYNDLPSALISSFISYRNPTGAEPVPNSALMNDTQNLKVSIKPGKTYMFRMVNMAAFAAQYVWFEGHSMRVVEVDGIYTKPAEAQMLYITAAQRYSVLVTMKNDTSTNYAIQAHMDEDLFDAIPDGLNSNVTGWLTYDNSKPFPAAQNVTELNPFDDFYLEPTDGMALLNKADHVITLDMKMDNLGDGANYAFFNDVTYVAPKVPTLYTAMTSGAFATNPEIYGKNTGTFVLKKHEIVDIVLNNMDPGKHPFHLHGHAFQLIYRSPEEEGSYANNGTFPAIPMRRDTVLVHPNGNMVLRFQADNPGVWLFHCHLEWHTASGLIATMVEAPLDLQTSLKIPQGHLDACAARGIKTSGNAAGNTANLLDLTGEPAPPKPLPAGFTARGIVALVFSCLAAFLGIAVISWYGAMPIATTRQDQIAHKQGGLVGVGDRVVHQEESAVAKS